MQWLTVVERIPEKCKKPKLNHISIYELCSKKVSNIDTHYFGKLRKYR